MAIVQPCSRVSLLPVPWSEALGTRLAVVLLMLLLLLLFSSSEDPVVLLLSSIPPVLLYMSTQSFKEDKLTGKISI